MGMKFLKSKKYSLLKRLGRRCGVYWENGLRVKYYNYNGEIDNFTIIGIDYKHYLDDKYIFNSDKISVSDHVFMTNLMYMHVSEYPSEIYAVVFSSKYYFILFNKKTITIKTIINQLRLYLDHKRIMITNEKTINKLVRIFKSGQHVHS